MAGRSLGTLTIDLVAKVGGFVGGLDKAERATKKWARGVQQNAAGAIRALSSLSVAAVTTGAAFGAAGLKIVQSVSKQVAATDTLAKSLKLSTSDLLAWQYAAEKAGLSGDKMGQIFQSVSKKIGDTARTQTGPAVEALNALGLSAEKLSRVAPDQQLLAIARGLSKIGSEAKKTSIAEALGTDLSKLLPLFENNNKKLNEFIQLSRDYGIAPDQSKIDSLLRINNIFSDLTDRVAGLKNEIAAGLARVDLSGLTRSFDRLHDVLTDPQVLDGLTKMVSQVADLTGWLIKAAAAAGSLAARVSTNMAALSGKIDTSNPAQVRARADLLQKQLRDGDHKSIWGDSSAGARQELAKLTGIIDGWQRDSAKKLAAGLAQAGAQVVRHSASTAPDFSGTNGKPKTKKTAHHKTGISRTDSAFQSLERNYLRQIALIDTTGKKTAEVTELQKLQFDLEDGRLNDVSAKQRVRLTSLAAELDQLKKVRKENQENIKLQEFIASLRDQNHNAAAELDTDFIGAGAGEKARSRARELLEIEQDFIRQQQDLQRQQQTGQIDASLYDRETEALRAACAERLAIQRDYYQKQDEQRNDWRSGISDALIDYVNAATDYSQIAANATTSIMNGATSSIADGLDKMLTGAASFKEGLSSIFESLGRSVIQTLEQMAAQAIVTKGILAGLSGISGGGGILGKITGFLTPHAKGGVYDSPSLSRYSNQVYNSPQVFAFAQGAGIFAEAGPEAIMPLTRAADGSLGVRAVGTGQTDHTYARLAATLERVNRDTAPRQTSPITIHTTVNGDPGARTLELLKQTQRAAVREALAATASQVASGTGDVGRAVGLGWNVARRTG